jgi:hypothetical protein
MLLKSRLSELHEGWAAYTTLGSRGLIARNSSEVDEEFAIARPDSIQLVPPSTLLNKPTLVPAYSVIGLRGSIARLDNLAGNPGNPELAVFQVVPPSMLLNTS